MVFGWVLYDLTVFGMSKEPYLAVRLLPGSAVAILFGLIAGLLYERYHRLYWSMLALAALALIVSFLYTPNIHPLLKVIPRVVFLLHLSCAVAVFFVCRRKCAPIRTVIAVGFTFSNLWWMMCAGISTSGIVFAFAGISVIATQLGWLKKVHTAVLFAALTGSVLYFGINGYMQLQLPRPDTPGPKLAHKSEHPNLIIIMLDTVRAKSLAPYGYNHITTPNIDDFVSKNAVIYTQARSTSSWTLPSHASLFTGRLPSEHNADYPRSGRNTSTVTDILYPAQRLGPELPTLAELLAQRGYQTGAIAANCAYLSYQFGLDRGFEHYDDRAPAMIRPYMSLAQILGFSLETGQLGYRDAETITDTSLAWLAKKRLDAPFFLFVNYLDAHYPYIPPRAFRELFSTDQPRNVLQPRVGIWELQYDRSLRYLDHHVGRLLSYFKEHNMLDKTVIIITSDHGETFGEHGFNGHGQTLYEEEIKVPLYVTSLNKNQDRTTDVPIVSSDVFYLILKKLGFKQTPAMKKNSIVAELFRSPRKVKMKGNHFDRDFLTWIEGVQKIIVSTKNSVEIYNIESDPEEKKNLATPGAELERISSFAERWWNEHPPPETETVTPVDDELLNRLKTLGYIDDADDTGQ